MAPRDASPPKWGAQLYIFDTRKPVAAGAVFVTSSATGEITAIRTHPAFRGAMERHAASDLVRYQGLDLIERWMARDVGNASLSGVVTVLDAVGRLTPAALMMSQPVSSGAVSRGRARLYLMRAAANDLIVPDPVDAPLSGDTRLALTRKFRAVQAGMLRTGLEAAAEVAPEMRPALARMDDDAFAQRVAAWVGHTIAARAEWFPADGSVWLFHGRDGGVRMLEHLIGRQRPGRRRLLETCDLSRAALARVGDCSRTHVIRLLADGERLGLLSINGRTLTFASRLSDDLETYFAGFFAVMRAAAMAALAET